MKYAFILNPAAGKGRDPSVYINAVESVAKKNNIEFSLWKTERPGHGRILAEEALKKGFNCIVAIGGDGTINEIARSLMHSNGVLGIIPKGSGNGFAREFGIPLNPVDACESLLQSKDLSIDVGRINNEYFFNVAGVGFDAKVGLAFNESQKLGRRGMIPYFTLGLKEYFSFKPPSLILRYDGKERRIQPFLLAVANCKQYGSGAMIAPQAIVNDGFLHIAVVYPTNSLKLLWSLPRVFNGTFDKAAFLETILTKEVVISLEHDVPYHVDGEIRSGEKVLTISNEHLALKLKVPNAYQVR